MPRIPLAARALLLAASILGHAAAYTAGAPRLGRRAALRLVGAAPAALLLSPAVAAPGAAPNMLIGGSQAYVPSQSDQPDAIQGPRADTYGQDSRENGIYRKTYDARLKDDARSKALLADYEASRAKLDTLSVMLDKGQYPKVMDLLLSPTTSKLRNAMNSLSTIAQDGKVCLISTDATQPLPKGGFGPEDCKLQFQASLAYAGLNELYVQAKIRNPEKCQAALTCFLTEMDAWKTML